MPRGRPRKSPKKCGGYGGRVASYNRAVHKSRGLTRGTKGRKNQSRRVEKTYARARVCGRR